MKPINRHPVSRRTFCSAAALLPAATLLHGCGGGGNSSTAPEAQPLAATAARHFSTDAPAKWVDIALRATDLVPPPGLPPPATSRPYAMAFLAAHDALNAIQPVYATYLAPSKAPGASPDAAVATAVHDVLVHEFPFAAALLDAAWATAISAITGGGAVDKGIATGRACAAAILAARASDGFANSEGPYTEGTEAGQYRFTPPFNFAAFVHLADMTPFAISSTSAYRSDAPYALTSAAYAADYAEVKALGSATSSVRTADESELAIFWLENIDRAWMQVACQVAASRGMGAWELTRALALILMAQSDSFSAGIESKYLWNFWRPITAIHLGDTDGNDATVSDASWASFDPVCPPVPDHPSTHAVAAGAGQSVITEVFGGDAATFALTSATLPGVTRHFTSFSQCAQEMAASRVFAGYHFRHATSSGLTQGSAIGSQVGATQLPRVS